MKGFIVASVNKKALRQSVGLESQLIRYTPVMGEDQEAIAKQHQEFFPDYTIIMTMPIDVLKKNIEVIENSIEKQNNTKSQREMVD